LLTKSQLEGISNLQYVCEKEDSLQLKLNWELLQSRSENEENDFFHYENGELVGFIGLYGFGSKVEVCGMVNPNFRRRGIFTQLFLEALKTIKKRLFKTILLNAPSNSQSAKDFLKSVTCSYSFSEYQMKWKETELIETEEVIVRISTPEDIDTEVILDVQCFGEDEAAARDFTQRIKQENLQQTFMIETKGKTVGKIRVSVLHGEAWIFGFAVFPQYQGKGIGRKALSSVVLKEHRAGHPIFLEVEAKNANALMLYESCGFKAFHSQDYYEYLG
jgi:ribosomal protein S18 acetylase RimI-like enzyme